MGGINGTNGTLDDEQDELDSGNTMTSLPPVMDVGRVQPDRQITRKEPEDDTQRGGQPSPMPSIPPPPSGAAPVSGRALYGSDYTNRQTLPSSMFEPVAISDSALDVPASPTTTNGSRGSNLLLSTRVVGTLDEPDDEELWANTSTREGRDVMSKIPAGRGCISTELPSERVASFISKLGLRGEQRGNLWFVYGTNERVATAFAELNTEITELSERSGIPAPSMYLDTYIDGSGLPLDQDFIDISPEMLRRGTNGTVIVSDDFHKLLRHPRVEIYVHRAEKNRGKVQGKGVIILGEFRSVINELKAGGAEKQFGREKEMQQVLAWATKFINSKDPIFSSFTIHGDAMMGKTRGAEEVIKELKALYQKSENLKTRITEARLRSQAALSETEPRTLYAKGQTTKADQLLYELEKLPGGLPYVVFIPAKDTRMGDSFSFFRTYAQQLLHTAENLFPGGLPEVFRGLQDMKSLDVASLSKQGPEIVANALHALRDSGNKFLIVTDDMQWADSESCDLLKRVFSKERQADPKQFGHLALLNLTRTGDQVMNEELLAILNSAQNSGSLSLKPLCFMDEGGTPTPLLVDFVYGLLRADPNYASVDAIVLKNLSRVAGGASGNPGLLTEVVRSMLDEGVIVLNKTGITVYSDRFLSWTAMGEADAMAAARIDRLLESPIQKEMLQYVIYLRETGECTYQFIANFFQMHLKRPDLLEAFGRLEKQGVFNLQKIDDSGKGNDQSIVGFCRDADDRRLKAIFGYGTDEKDEISIHAYRNVALYLYTYHDRFSRAITDDKNAGSKELFTALLERFSPYAIYVMASKAGMTEMVERFALDAFKDAFARGQFDVALSIYEYMKSQPAMSRALLEFGKNNDLQLDLIQCMQVKRNAYAAEVEALGEKIRYYFFAKAESMGENQTFSKEDFARIERLHTLMGNFYFLRGFSTVALRRVGAEKLKEWGGGLAEYLPDGGKNIFTSQEKRFQRLQAVYNNMRAEYLMRNYMKAIASYGEKDESGYKDHEEDSTYTIVREKLLLDYPSFEQDPRFLTIDLEASRLFANAFNEGWSRALAPGEEGYIKDMNGFYNDSNAADLAVMFEGNSLRANVKKSFKYYRNYLEIANLQPELLSDRTQIYRVKKALGDAAGRIGRLSDAMCYFYDARSDAIKYGDNERYADVLLAMSSAIPNTVYYYQLTKDATQQRQIIDTAQIIQRNEPGAILPLKENIDKHIEYNTSVATYFILQWAAQYASNGADILASMGNVVLYEIVLVNLLWAISTASEVVARHGAAIDDVSENSSTTALSHLITDAIRRITERLPGGNVSFLDAHRALDQDGKPDEYWSFYIAPFLANLMRNITKLDRYPQLLNIVMDGDKTKATFESAIPALSEEAASLISENGFIAYLNFRTQQMETARNVLATMIRENRPQQERNAQEREVERLQQKPPKMKESIPQYSAALEKKIADVAMVSQRVRLLVPKK